MKKRRILSMALAAILALSAFSGCSNDSGKKKIGILKLTDHVSLDMVEDNVISKLAELGYVDGENCEIEKQSAQNEQTNVESIASKFVGDKKDLIITIATSPSQVVLGKTSEIPIVFAAVTDPVTAKLVSNLEKPGANITGTSDMLAVELIIDFGLKIKPDIKTLGVIYNSGEPNSLSTVDTLRTYLETKGIKLEEVIVTNTSEIPQAAESICAKVDAVFTPNDNTVASSVEPVVDAAIKNKIPFLAGADFMVEKGALGMVGVDYAEVGKATGEMVAEILDGKSKVGDIPVKVFDTNLNVYLNKDTAKAIGLTVPDEILNDPKLIAFGE